MSHSFIRSCCWTFLIDTRSHKFTLISREKKLSKRGKRNGHSVLSIRQRLIKKLLLDTFNRYRFPQPPKGNKYWKKTSQELRMLSLSLFIEGTQWMLKLLFSIVRNVISVSKVTSLEDRSFRVFSKCIRHCLCLCLCLCLFYWSGHVSSSPLSNGSKVGVFDRFLRFNQTLNRA